MKKHVVLHVKDNGAKLREQSSHHVAKLSSTRIHVQCTKQIARRYKFIIAELLGSQVRFRNAQTRGPKTSKIRMP